MEWAVVVPVAVPGPVLAPTLPPDTAAGTDLEPVPLTAPVAMVLQACVVSGRKEAEGHAVADDTKAIHTHIHATKKSPQDSPNIWPNPSPTGANVVSNALGTPPKTERKARCKIICVLQYEMCVAVTTLEDAKWFCLKNAWR